MNTEPNHEDLIMDQFTRQAVPFSRHHASDDELLQTLIRSADLDKDASVLDVACGPGLVSFALARVVRQVTGLDVVPAMLDRATGLQTEKGIPNVTWKLGSAVKMPFADGEFDAVITRFSFHHMTDPGKALVEMKRVCKPGGTLVVSDVAPAPACRDAYDSLEKLRDPSHTSALTDTELGALGSREGLIPVCKVIHSLDTDLEALLAVSFPPEGNAASIRALLRTDISDRANRFGVHPHEKDGRIRFTFPIVTMVWKKNATL